MRSYQGYYGQARVDVYADKIAILDAITPLGAKLPEHGGKAYFYDTSGMFMNKGRIYYIANIVDIVWDENGNPESVKVSGPVDPESYKSNLR